MTCERQVLLVVHTGRDEATETARRVEKVLSANGIGLRVLAAEQVEHQPFPSNTSVVNAIGTEIQVVDADERAAEGCEMVLVLGGDGTFLRAAELARNVEIPVLGVNLGRIGFLAEAEAAAIDTVLDQVVTRNYSVENRMTLDIVVRVDGQIKQRGWALNEASLEKGPRLGYSASSWRSTVVPSRRSGATACWSRLRPGPPRTRSLQAARSSGPISSRSWWCPTMLTLCSRGPW